MWRAVGLALVLGAVGVPMLISASMPWWWFGAGFLAAGLASLVYEFRLQVKAGGAIHGWWERWNETRYVGPERWGLRFVPVRLAIEVLVLLVIAGLVAVMAPELLVGDRPVGYDHPVHYMKAWRLENEFLLEGRLRGWSHQWLGGYPAQYMYPWGADFLVVAVHALTLGLVDFGTAYAWAIAVFWAFRGWALYKFTSIGAGRWAGIIAAVLWMTDTAGARIGGWNYAMAVGVWPMSLAVALCVWATAWLSRVATDGRPRQIAGFAICLGLALMTHPYAVFHFALVGPVAVVCAWFADDVASWLAASGRIVVGYVVGIAIGLLWLLPFVLSGEIDSNFGGRWRPMYEMGVTLYNTALLPGTWAWIMAIGAVGVVVSMVSRRFHGMLAGWLAVGGLVFASTDFLAAFHLLETVDGLQGLHYKRFIQMLKPYWIACAAFAVVGAFRMWRQTASAGTDGDSGDGGRARRDRRVSVAVGAFLVVAALAPILVGFGESFGKNHVQRNLQTDSDRPHRRAREQLGAWFDQNYPGGWQASDEFFRVAYCCGYHDHSFVDMGAKIPFPVYKIGYTPATSFEHRIKSDDREILDALNVRYVFSVGPTRRSYLEKVETFGRLHLYEIKDWNRRPFELISGAESGAGESVKGASGDAAKLVEFGRERIVIDVPEEAVAGEGGKLRVNVSNFSRWGAWRDGEWLPISETTLAADPKTGFMTVPLAPGRYVFEFQHSWIDWLAWLFGLCGIAGFVALWLAGCSTGRVKRGWDWLCERGIQIRERFVASEAVVFGGVVGVMVLVACVLAWRTPTIRVEHVPVPSKSVSSVEFDSAKQLPGATVGIRRGGEFDACRQVFGRFLCGGAMWKQPHVKIEDFGFEYDRYRCIWAHPIPDGPIEFAYRDVPAADGMIGYFGVAESGSKENGPPVTLSVGVDGIERYSAETTQDETLHGFELPLSKWAEDGEADVTLKVDAKQTGVRHLCFNAQTVTLEEGRIEESETYVPDIPRASGQRP